MEVEVVVGTTWANNWYGLALSLAVSGVDILGITGSYGFTVHTVLRLPAKEARAKVCGMCSSHICVILAFYMPGLFSSLTHHFGHHTVPKPVHILQHLFSAATCPQPSHLWGPHQADQGLAPRNLHIQETTVLMDSENSGA